MRQLVLSLKAVLSFKTGWFVHPPKQAFLFLSLPRQFLGVRANTNPKPAKLLTNLLLFNMNKSFFSD